MITSVRLERFKRFGEVTLRTAELTVLTGMNGAGKTSVVHALLLARQAAVTPERNYVELNGVDALQLGEASDLIHRQSKGDTFAVEICEAASARWTMQVSSDERSLNALVVERPLSYEGVLARSAPAFAYLCAERFGPRDVLGASSIETAQLGTGVHGEFTAQVLANCDRRRVSPKRSANAGAPGRPGYLPYQVEAWMSAIVCAIEIDAHWVPGTSTTTLRFKTPGVQSEWTRPANMGFGVSYALPIVVSGLLVSAGGLMIVENPEAHLHPAAQSRMGAFLARLAGDGVQVLVETHSDHVLNGIRRAVVEERASLSSEQVSIYFFRDEATDGAAVEPLSITSSGQLSSWPAGFFDQSQSDLAALARASRSKA